MSEVIDLDSIGAARREEKKERPQVKYGGMLFQLPSEMPFAVVESVGRIQRNDANAESSNSELAESMADIARALFGARFREFLDLGPSVEDLTSLLENIAPAYGLKADEAEVTPIDEPVVEGDPEE